MVWLPDQNGCDIIPGLVAGHLKGVKGVFGFHLWPTLPTGTIHTRKGTIMASACQFDLTVKVWPSKPPLGSASCCVCCRGLMTQYTACNGCRDAVGMQPCRTTTSTQLLLVQPLSQPYRWAADMADLTLLLIPQASGPA